MRFPLPLAVLMSWLSAGPSLQAFPEGVAQFILGRPVTEKNLESQLGGLNGFVDPIIVVTDAITISAFDAGDPRVKLSVLIVEPRHYGIAPKETIDLDRDPPTYSIGVNFNSDGPPPESLRKLLEEAEADAEGNKQLNPTPEQYAEILKEQARAGGQKPSTTQPRTLFLLNGYGVPKKAGLPLALLLAEHGIRTILPDLRGQGESGGEGVTWGKEEPGDLADLLTALQSKEMVEEGPVAVLGISYGAAMASLWSAKDSRIQTAILVAPYQRADTKIVEAYDKFLGGMKLPFQLSDKVLARGTEIAAEKLEVSWEDLAPARAIPDIRPPVLFVASTGDEIVPREEVAELHRRAPDGSKLHVFEELPHLLLGINYTEMETLIVDWLEATGFTSS